VNLAVLSCSSYRRRDTVLAGTFEHYSVLVCRPYWLWLFKAVTGHISDPQRARYWTGHDTDYKITSFCQSVCLHSYGRHFGSILMKFCTVIRGPKSKIEFVWDKNLITPSPILPQIFKNLHYGLWGLQSGITRFP